MIVDGKRYPQFELRKVKQSYEQAAAYRREDYLALIYTKPGRIPRRYRIFLDHGGKLAGSFPERETFLGSYRIAFSKLTPEQQEKVRAAITHMVKNGDPIDNDESVFA